MKRIRMGQDFTCNVELKSLGQGLVLDKNRLSVTLVAPGRERTDIDTVSVSGSRLSVRIAHDIQHAYGIHRLEIWLDRGENGQTIADKTLAFELVALSTQATETDGGEVDLGELDVVFIAPFVQVEDTLESESSTHALSANMGRVLSETVEGIATDLESMSTQVSNMQKDVATNKLTITTAQQDLATKVSAADAKAESNTSAINSILSSQESQQQEFAHFRETEKSTQEAIDTIKLNIGTLETDNNNRIASLESITQQHGIEQGRHSSAIDTLQSASTTAANTLSEHGVSIESLQSRTSSIASQIGTLTSTSSTMQQDISNINAELARQNTAHTSDIQQIQGSVSVLNTTVTQLQEEDADDKAFLNSLRLAQTEGFLMAYEPEQLNPEPVATYGESGWLKRYYPYLVDYTRNTGTSSEPVGRLKNNNWLRFADGKWAPVVGITEAQRAECDGALYWDAAASNKYCEAGEFDAAKFWDDYKEAGKLYKADGSEARILRPWETTRTDLGIYKCFADDAGNPVGVTPVDGVEGKSGKVWRGMLSDNALRVWDGVDVSRFRLAPTGFSPSPVTTKNNQVRSFFYAYNGTDSNTANSVGAYARCTMFTNQGLTYPRTGDVHQVSLMNMARACNADPNSPVPFAEGGYHAMNTVVVANELLFRTKYLADPALFSGGVCSNDTCNNEATWMGNGGVRYRLQGESEWRYVTFGATSAFSYGESGNVASISNMINGEYAKVATLEMQMAVSYAAECGIAEGEHFTFYGHEYWYVNVPGGVSLQDGGMDVRVYSLRKQTFQAYTTSGAPTSVEMEVVLRVGLMGGMDMSGDIYAYCGGGYEMVAYLHGDGRQTYAQGESGVATITTYLEPDQRKWVREPNFVKTGDAQFVFDGKYEEMCHFENSGGYWTVQHYPYTIIPKKMGANRNTGECSYLWSNNRFNSTLLTRTRLASRFRLNAYNGFASARSCNANNAASNANTIVGGLALVRFGD